MNNTLNSFLDLAKEYCKAFSEKGLNVQFKEEKRQEYLEGTKNRYNAYKDTYMSTDVEFLDRHKVAAIMVVQGLKLGIIDSSAAAPENSEGYINIASANILLLCAIDYLIAQINEIITQKSKLEPLDDFLYPKAWSCDTDYIDVVCRNLYFAQKDYQLNEMELADKFFLLEYICLLCTFNRETAEEYFRILKEYQIET